ncbi:unnamed protein product [Prunus brigantina]
MCELPLCLYSTICLLLLAEKEMNSLVPVLHPSQVTTIDVTQLHHDSHTRSVVVKTIHDACQKKGLFSG